MHASLQSGMHSRAVTYFIALITVLSHSAGELVIVPESTESKVGDTIYFNCSTNLTSGEIFWHHGLKYIYIGEMILDPYRGRFEIDRNVSNGSHNLVIHSVEPGDAGKYICIDDDGFGTKRSAELIVLENDPDCQSNIQPDGVIGQNTFRIPPDEVQLTCSITYHGNIPPQTEWKKAGDNGSIKDNVTSIFTPNNRLIYTLKLKGDISLDNSSFVCQTTRSTLYQYKCTSEIIKILYFFERNTTLQNVVRGERITCTVSNSTFPCTSQWYHDDYTCPLSCNETITTHLLGEYLCTAKCIVRGIDYSFEALKAVVVEAPTYPPPSTSGNIAAAVVVPIVILIIIATSIIAVLVLRSKRKTQSKLREVEEQPIEFLLGKRGRVKPDDQERVNDDIAEVEIKLLRKIREETSLAEQAILGAAILGEKLYIVRERSSKLQVYDCKNLGRDYQFLPKVKEIVAAFDICACKVKSCLYVMNKRKDTTKEVVRINDEGKVLSNWSTKDKAGGYLSATPKGNVIITDQNKQLLLEYSSDGTLEREINLPGCNNPWHAIKLDDDHYIVSHGTLFDPLHRVCLVNKAGIIEKSFGHDCGSTKDQLNMPYYLAVGVNGCVMVADLCNNRVLLLNSKLEFKRKIVPMYKQRFRSPRRIFLADGLLGVVITAGDPSTDNVQGDSSAENDDLKKKIEEDCRVLVFDIGLQPLV